MKNYKTIYESSNHSSALSQSCYLVEETDKAVFTPPQDDDLLRHLPGGQITIERPLESSSERSGRHHLSARAGKISTNWQFKTNIHMKKEIGLAPALETLFRHLLGNKDGRVYSAKTPPSKTFTLLECSDSWARQAVGAYVDSATIDLPGDGEASVDWQGNARIGYHVGITACDTDNNGGNEITVREPERLPVGAAVMILKADGVTRSNDMSELLPFRTVISHKENGIIEIDGAKLTDCSGTEKPIYIAYYEPDNPQSFDNPLLGHDGKIEIEGFNQSVKSLSLAITNNHEKEEGVFGSKGLGPDVYNAVNRLTVEPTSIVNMSHKTLSLINQVAAIKPQAMESILGFDNSLCMKIKLPRVFFNQPGFSVPDEGTTTVELKGTAYQTEINKGDEIEISFQY